MEIGVDSFVAATVDAAGRAVDPARHLSELLEAITLADEVGLDVFGIGEHHRREFLDSAPTVILAAAAARTRRIRLTSAVTVLSAADPVRVFQEFATLDLLSNGRAEIVAGRGSFIEAFPLFGLELEDYDSLFAEKLDLLLNIRENTHVHWSGKHRAPLTGQGVYPRPLQNPLPVWLGVGGTPGFFRSRRHPRAAANGRDHRRRTAPFSAIDRSLPRSGIARRTLSRSAQGGHPFVRLCRRQCIESGKTNSFPVMREAFLRLAGNAAGHLVTRAHFDALLGPTGALHRRRSGNRRGKNPARERVVRRHFPSHVPDERGSIAARETDARDRAARDARCSSRANRTRVRHWAGADTNEVRSCCVNHKAVADD